MDELKKLESTNTYLFHGSMTAGLRELVPRQAMSHSKPDGSPAVFAAEQVEPPIFMAVLGSRKLGGWGRKDLPGFGFFISEDHMAKAKRENWSGYVYVVERKSFVKHHNLEWRSSKPVKVIKAIPVGIKDLPTPIMAMSHDEYMAYVRPNMRSKSS